MQTRPQAKIPTLEERDLHRAVRPSTSMMARGIDMSSMIRKGCLENKTQKQDSKTRLKNKTQKQGSKTRLKNKTQKQDSKTREAIEKGVQA